MSAPLTNGILNMLECMILICISELKLSGPSTNDMLKMVKKYDFEMCKEAEAID